MSKSQLTKIIDNKKDELWKIKAPYLTEGQEIYFKRALINIFSDKTLAAMAKTEKGAESIFLCISKALQMGLQIGGQIPQAYILPFENFVSLSPTADGYRFIALSKPAVLKDIRIQIVYEGDDCKIDSFAGEVKHEINITNKKRNLIGIYAVITKLNGDKYADFMSRGDIEYIRDNWSKQAKGKAWMKSFDQMALAKATKKFLKPFAALKEGLKMAIASSEDEENLCQPEDRTENINDNLENIINSDEDREEEVVEEITEEEKKESNKKDLF